MENIKNSICLFDVDGTLTESRKLIQKTVINSLRELSFATEIGFLTGSDLDFAKEQLWPVFADPELSLNCHILPCNGTKYYIPNPDTPGQFIEIHENNMYSKLGHEKFQLIMKTIMQFQAEIAELPYDIPFTGHHIQNRDSMINWSPIGRNTVDGDRKQFMSIDKMFNLRQKYHTKFVEFLHKHKMENILVKIAGDTSFDIFPSGWDKTYALKHFPEEEWDVFFVGDRCSPTGNDWELYNHLRPIGRSFETSGPEETVEIIDIHLHRLIGGLDDNS
jgi:phosphomannomutase